jgi:hypothetical protein
MAAAESSAEALESSSDERYLQPVYNHHGGQPTSRGTRGCRREYSLIIASAAPLPSRAARSCDSNCATRCRPINPAPIPNTTAGILAAGLWSELDFCESGKIGSQMRGMQPGGGCRQGYLTKSGYS